MRYYELHLEKFEIAGAHSLKLPYNSPCGNLHGHNWLISIHIRSISLAEHGMILDFKHIKDYLKTFDHKNLNEMVDFNPSAENLAEHFGEFVKKLAQEEGCLGLTYVKCEVQEAEHNVAAWVWQEG